MADEVHEETEFFNQDFTTATRWEVFNARLEEIIHDWKLPFKSFTGERLAANQLSECEWDSKEEQISYDGIDFRITQFCSRPPTASPNDDKSDDESASIEVDASKRVKSPAEQTQCQAFVDLMALENNWCTLDERSHLTIHPLARWYGLRQFVVVSATEPTKLTENQRRMLLSSIHIAIGETSCETPFFVQALRQQQHVYSGELNSAISHDITAMNKRFLCLFLQAFVNSRIRASHSTSSTWLIRIHRANICPGCWPCSKRRCRSTTRTR